MALITITGDCDLVKVKKGEECLAYICADCQLRHFGEFNRHGTSREHQDECQCCGHLGFGVMCVCTIGDWLAIKPLRKHIHN